MMHVLHPQKDQLLGYLDREQYWKDDHQHGLDGAHFIQFTTHSDTEEAGMLVDRCRLLRQASTGGWQEFVAYEITTRSNRTKKLIATGSEAELDQLKIIEPGPREGYTLEQYGNEAIAGTGWTLGTVDYAGFQTHTFDKHLGAYAFLCRVAEYFDRELRFRVEVSGNRVIGRYVDLVERIGADKRKEIVAGENLIDIERTVHSDRIVTALYCIGPEREDGTRLTVLVTDEDAFQRWNWNGMHIIDFYEPQTEDAEMTLDRLTTLGNTALKKRIDSVVEYVVNAAVFADDDVNLGDTLRIKDEGFEPPLYAESRAVFVKEPIDGEAIDKTYTIGEIVELKKEEVLGTFLDLQRRYGTRVIKSPTRPPGNSNVIWIQTGGDKDFEVAHIWDAAINDWVAISPVKPEDIGAEPEIPEGPTPPDPTLSKKWVDTSGEIPELKMWSETTQSWVAVQGPPGKNGYTPVKGTDYFDGIDGQDGIDGTSAYVWIRYSQNADGSNMVTDPADAKYIGIATTETDSAPILPAAYKWTLIKGTEGVPGEPGSDGRTSYLHIKYSNDGGQTLTANSGETVGDWIGTYVDFNSADSASVSVYTWNKVKGDKGDAGYTPVKGTDYFDGKDGQDGLSSYLWIRYSQNADGTGFVDSPTNAKYIGVATTTTSSAPVQASGYRWSLVKGTDGQPGEPGVDGKTSYLHIKYSNDGGATFTANAGEDAGDWIGTYTDFTQADSNLTNAYTWNKVKGETGDTGNTGRSVTSVTKQYYLSTSSTSLSGGSWSSGAPTYVSGRYMWERTVTNYANPSGSEYGTPVLSPEWEGIISAQQTADGKNTVFHSPAQPSIAGRKENDVWFDTDDGNAMYRFVSGAWAAAPFGENAIVANSITANHIKSLVGLNVNDQFIVDANGNVKLSGDITGASGDFGGSLSSGDGYNKISLVGGSVVNSEGRALFDVDSHLPDMHDKDGLSYVYGKIYTHRQLVSVAAKSYSTGDYIEVTATISDPYVTGIQKVLMVAAQSESKEWYAYERLDGRVFYGDLISIKLRISPHYGYTSGGTAVMVNVMVIGAR